MEKYRSLGMGHMMLDAALGFEREPDYSKISVYSSKDLQTSRNPYLINYWICRYAEL
jgi:hypothetical protein